MRSKRKIAVLILIGIFSVVTRVQAQIMPMPGDHIMVMPNDIKWVDAPPALPTGAKVAVLEGDPKVAGSFTMRIKLPANYKIMPHSHPANEHITVIEGSFYMGLGDKFDEKTAKQIPAGGFVMMNAGTRHYAFTEKESVLQLHGMGPWDIIYVNAADDPRNKKIK